MARDKRKAHGKAGKKRGIKATAAAPAAPAKKKMKQQSVGVQHGLFRRPSRPSPASPSPRQTRVEGVLGSSHGQALGLVGLHGTRICGGLGTHQGWTSPGTRPEATEPALSGSLSRLAGHIIMLLYTEHPVTGGSTRTLHYLLCTMYLVSLKYLCRGSSLFLEQG